MKLTLLSIVVVLFASQDASAYDLHDTYTSIINSISTTIDKLKAYRDSATNINYSLENILLDSKAGMYEDYGKILNNIKIKMENSDVSVSTIKEKLETMINSSIAEILNCSTLSKRNKLRMIKNQNDIEAAIAAGIEALEEVKKNHAISKKLASNHKQLGIGKEFSKAMETEQAYLKSADAVLRDAATISNNILSDAKRCTITRANLLQDEFSDNLES